MSFEQDYYEERRNKARRSSFWKGALVTLGLIIGLIILAVVFSGDGRPAGPHIARYFISDIIYDNPDRDLFLSEIADDENVKAVILRINSPGGTTVGSEALFASIREIAENKPVVAVLGEMAASGGYIAAIAADHVIARGNTVTGSIGVIMEYPDVTSLMETLGVEMQTIRSSDIKGGLSPFRQATPAEIAANQAMIEEAYAWFRGLVGERRGMDDNTLDQLANGGVYSGRQAVANGLIDALGDERNAVAYLESLDGDLIDIDVETWHEAVESRGLLGYVGAKLGINPLLEQITGKTGPRLYSLKR